MKYIALQELKTANGTVMPGDFVPEAASWDRCWFTTGHVAAYPDEMVEDVRARMHTGILQMHGQEFGQDRLGLALSPAAQEASAIADASSKSETQPGSAASPTGPDSPPASPKLPLAGEAPLGKQAVIADAGEAPIVPDDLGKLDPPAQPTNAKLDPPAMTSGDVAEAAGEAQDDAQADAAEDPSKPTSDAPRRRGRRGRG